ncbi:MAG: glycosyltransferase [Solirubrobacteraceae bacterium]
MSASRPPPPTRMAGSARGSDPRIVCVLTRAMLPAAQVMARSLLRHQPTWDFQGVLIGAAGDDDSADELAVVSVDEALNLDSERMLAHHGPDELIQLLVPRVLLAHGRDATGPVIHLPASSWILGDLAPLTRALRDRAVLLVPRLRRDPPDDGLEPSARRVRLTGRVAADLMGVDGSPPAVSFLRWWIGRLDEIAGSPDGVLPGHNPRDRYWLQRSLELACARVEVATLDDLGCELSAWNLPEHELSTSANKMLVDGDWPLRLVDLGGFEPDRPFRLNPWASRVRVSRDPVLTEICTRYAAELDAAGWSDVALRRELAQRLPNGLVFDASLQSLFGMAHTLGADIGDPFSSLGANKFTRWLREPAVHGGRHGINRYLLHRVLRERWDVVTTFPDLDGTDGPDLMTWARDSGRVEMAIPDELMPGADAPAPVRQPVTHAPQRGVSRRPAVIPNGTLGVRVSGYLGHVLGLGAAARGYASALDAAGIPVSTATVSVDRLRPSVRLEANYGRHLVDDVVAEGANAFELICVNPGELPSFIAELGSDHFSGLRIGVWAWETNSIPDGWAPAFELVDEIWVYSRFVADNIAAVTDIPVIALPPPVPLPTETAPPIRLGVPDGFIFLFMFDYSSTNARKNPVGLVEAFRRAFAPGEGPQLLIKTINAPLLPLSEEEVLWAARGRADIHVVDCSLTNPQRDALIATCDCYVSLHRSEGFGLTMAEAMALGKPVIATAYSGNIDFMDADNSFLVDYELTRVGPEGQIYPADGEWAQPSIEHAAELMRRVYADPEGAARVGARAREDIARRLSPEATGAQLRRRLEQLAQPKSHPNASQVGFEALPSRP